MQSKWSARESCLLWKRIIYSLKSRNAQGIGFWFKSKTGKSLFVFTKVYMASITFSKSVGLESYYNLHFPSLPSNMTESPGQKTHIKSNMHLHHRALPVMFALKCVWSRVAFGALPPWWSSSCSPVSQFPFWNLGSNQNTLHPTWFAEWEAEQVHHILVSDTASIDITWHETRFLWTTSHNPLILNCS